MKALKVLDSNILSSSLDIQSNLENLSIESKVMSEGSKRKYVAKDKLPSSKKLKMKNLQNIKKDEKLVDLGGYKLIILPKTEKEIERVEDFGEMAKEEYSKVSKETPFETHKLSFQEKQKRFPTATRCDNWKKNRYNDVLSNEETRFQFKMPNNFKNSISLITLETNPFQEDMVDEEKYINANYIKGTHQSNSTFIATQAPLKETLSEFYEMIWQSKSKIIISLSSIVEGGKTKMFQFWPEKSKSFDVAHFSITVEQEMDVGNGLTCCRKIKMINLSTETERTIYQIHFTGWPDHDVPEDPSSLIEIYRYQRIFEEEGLKEDLNGPPIVHCSAGIGRTATYISFVFGSQIIDFLANRNLDVDKTFLNSQVDVSQIVSNIRKQRSGSVQTWQQYALVYKALNYYMKN